MNQCADSWKNNLVPAIPKPLICNEVDFESHHTARHHLKLNDAPGNRRAILARLVFRRTVGVKKTRQNIRLESRFWFDWGRGSLRVRRDESQA